MQRGEGLPLPQSRFFRLAGERGRPAFAQRFTATFAADGKTIAGRWEIAEEGRDWRTNFDVTYTRVS